ncbi:MAG: glycosyltransferase [Nitrosomonadales bacterium]|nr:glycosyltransferase [Nitrosomonadales bacterium]
MKISVCMAAYNGENHIEKQISSILCQLKPDDELIIVDDCSQDETANIIKNFNDSRIKLLKNKYNSGVVATFENALSMAKGDIIFLSDQDDVWLDNKVSFVRNFFMSNNVDLIVHDALIENEGRIISDSLFSRINSSDGIFKNLYSNSYTGCCMAFKPHILKKVLPIPLKQGIFHDAWIGILSKFYRFKIIFITTPLIIYHRHEANVSSMKRRAIYKIIPDRINLLISLFQRIVNDK